MLVSGVSAFRLGVWQGLIGGGARLGTPSSSAVVSCVGGQVIAADNDPSQSFSGLNLAAHPSYWDPGSDSLKNLGRIVDGQYGDVTVIHMPPPNGSS
jgi:hypothetical protein